MGKPPEFVAYVLANVGLVAITGFLASLSFLAHSRSRGQRSYAIAGLGFVCIILSGLSESIYTLVVDADHLLTGVEFLLLQAVEDIFIAVGLGLLFLAITKHESGSSRGTDDAALVGEADHWITSEPSDD